MSKCLLTTLILSETYRLNENKCFYLLYLQKINKLLLLNKRDVQSITKIILKIY